MARVTWSPQAREDLREIVSFIGRDSKAIARGVGEGIARSTRRLRDFPESGRGVSEFNDESLREVIVQNYRVIYQVGDSGVNVLTVIHGARALRDVPQTQ